MPSLTGAVLLADALPSSRPLEKGLRLLRVVLEHRHIRAGGPTDADRRVADRGGGRDGGLDQVLAIDGVRDRLTHRLVLQDRIGHVHAAGEDPVGVVAVDGEVGVFLGRADIPGLAQRGDVDLARLERGQADCSLG